MNSTFIKIAIALLTVLLVTGCGDKRYDIASAPLITNFKGNGSIVVATQDQRSFVLSGEKNPTYIGRQFMGYGVPAKIFTRSGRTVAADISNKIATSIEDNGFEVKTIRINHNEKFDLSNRKLTSLEYDRIILVTINQLRAESFQEVEFQWSFCLEMYDRAGTLLAQEENSGFADRMLHNYYTGYVSGNQGQKVIIEKIGVILLEMLSSPELQNGIETIHSKGFMASGEADYKDDDILILEECLENDQVAPFRNYSIQLVRKKIKNQDSLDQLADIIWAQRNSEDGKIVDGLCYLCKIFIFSKHPRYRAFFEQLINEGGTRKLRGYAKKTSECLPSAAVAQYDPTERNEIADSRKKSVTKTAVVEDELKSITRQSAYLLSDSQLKAMYKIGLFWDKRLGINNGCKAGAQVKPRDFIPLQPIEFASKKHHPITGAWIQRFIFERCGEKRIYNALFFARKDKEPLCQAYYPGNTIASMQLVHDAMINANIAAFLKIKAQDINKSCDEFKLIDTKLTQSPHDVTENGKVFKGVWDEEWTLRGCGETVKVTGSFTPNGRGGTSFTFE